MTKNEFLELAIKYDQGACSEDEKRMLSEFCEKAQIKSFINGWQLSEEEELRIRGIQRINTVIKQTTKISIKKRRILAWRVASVFIGLIASGYFLYQYALQPSEVFVAENEITLQLADGTIKVIDEKATVKRISNNGITIAHQNGNQLIYNEPSKNDYNQYPRNDYNHPPQNNNLAYNILKVPYGKKFDLLLSDGTKVNLNSGSSLKYPVQFLKGLQRQVYIKGEAFLDVAKDTLHPFVVKTENLNVMVLGTRFNVNSYPEDTFAEVVLEEGSVSLFTNSEGYSVNNSILLEPGYKAVFNKGNAHISKEEVITDRYTSWRKGKLIFRNMRFDDMIKKLERHYNVLIINNNKELSDEIFNASYEKVSIETVFENLKKYYNIKSKIEGKTITIQ